MTVHSEEQFEREMQALWARRGDLSRRELDRLYQLVRGFLIQRNPRHYKSLRRCVLHTDRADLVAQLIDDFYCDVVYSRGLNDSFQATPLEHAGALLTYYKNYLTDRIRRCLREKNARETIDGEFKSALQASASRAAGIDADEGEGTDLAAVRRFMEESDSLPWDEDPADCDATSQDHAGTCDTGEPTGLETNGDAGTAARDEEKTEDPCGVSDAHPDASEQSVQSTSLKTTRKARVHPGGYRSLVRISQPSEAEDELEADGLMRRIRPAAQAFLDGAVQDHSRLGEPPWILLYLARHHCQDDPDARVSMSTLAKDYGIPSYHQKAQQLGITSARGGFPSLDAFARTLLGRWLQGIGIAIVRENLSEIRTALKILCYEALQRVKAAGGCPDDD